MLGIADMIRVRQCLNMEMISTMRTMEDIATESTVSCDLLVSDIYGKSCGSLGLPSELLASCTGKASRDTSLGAVCMSLLLSFAVNVAQLGLLHAIRYNCKHVVVVGLGAGFNGKSNPLDSEPLGLAFAIQKSFEFVSSRYSEGTGSSSRAHPSIAFLVG